MKQNNFAFSAMQQIINNMRSSQKFLLEKKKPGGPITKLGAKRIVDPSSATSEIRTSLTDYEGEVTAAADDLGISPRTLYNYISDDSSLEKLKDKLDDEDNDDKQVESILSNIYRRLLREATEQEEADFAKKILKKLSSAGEDGIGMLTKSFGSKGISVILYKTNVFVGNILANLDTGEDGDVDRQAIADATDKSIVGMITLDKAHEPCADAMVVKYIFSREGYGPTLYEIGMQLSPSGRIMSDRRAVSDYAAKVYKTIHTSRPDIQKIPLDDIEHGDTEIHRQRHTPSKQDDCEVWYDMKPEREFLDYAFQGSGNVDLQTLEKNHQEAMKMLKYYLDYVGWKPGTAEEFLSNVADMLFGDVYHDIPMSARGLKFAR